ncbi:uncharacterized protein LOC132716857 [Ruditapes philippinarum]|uniref:uncharacterized protein LOC132716857 n=1 Tax=Ruditapes philippinarum TaxID=129788 RepID=UPI00295BFFA3|nr:uncharacterized protein LOC132716857 [Ruditapes philippinarum]
MRHSHKREDRPKSPYTTDNKYNEKDSRHADFINTRTLCKFALFIRKWLITFGITFFEFQPERLRNRNENSYLSVNRNSESELESSTSSSSSGSSLRPWMAAYDDGDDDEDDEEENEIDAMALALTPTQIEPHQQSIKPN